MVSVLCYSTFFGDYRIAKLLPSETTAKRSYCKADLPNSGTTE